MFNGAFQLSCGGAARFVRLLPPRLLGRRGAGVSFSARMSQLLRAFALIAVSFASCASGLWCRMRFARPSSRALGQSARRMFFLLLRRLMYFSSYSKSAQESVSGRSGSGTSGGCESSASLRNESMPSSPAILSASRAQPSASEPAWCARSGTE